MATFLDIWRYYAVSQLRRLVARYSSRRSGFDSKSVFVGCLMDKVVFVWVLTRFLQFSTVRMIAAIPQLTFKSHVPATYVACFSN
jgi:hypothetical protein